MQSCRPHMAHPEVAGTPHGRIASIPICHWQIIARLLRLAVAWQ